MITHTGHAVPRYWTGREPGEPAGAWAARMALAYAAGRPAVWARLRAGRGSRGTITTTAAREGTHVSEGELYDVTLAEVTTRYIRETPVRCVVFHKQDGTAVTVRLRSEQMTDLAARLGQKVADEGQPWP